MATKEKKQGKKREVQAQVQAEHAGKNLPVPPPRLRVYYENTVRDFRGVNTRSFDGRGNYTLGVKEQMIFPEINYDMVEQIHGMDITFVTTTNKDDQAFALLRELGMPFRGEEKPIITQQ